ncbi:unnamed protein product [Moneuplotes crassus]|uniref:Uncharacterized protein n=1 Tax=Euplotes crassus TaxID=5936 RepID=A0AAD1X7E9_EUPCR|nr:unnamed protein product [Moneuplotes crassus]
MKKQPFWISKCCTKTTEFVKSLDVFGSPIQMFYENNTRFKTIVGGICSLIIVAISVLFSVQLLKVMFERSKLNYTFHSIVRDLTNDHEDEFPGRFGFDIAIGFRGDTTSLLDPIYQQLYELEVVQKIVTNKGGVITEQLLPLELQKCGSDFPYSKASLVEDFKINQYVCIKNKDFSVSGNRYSQVRKSIGISLSKCNSTKTADCKTDSEINADALLRELEVLMIDSYFDLNSISNPVQTYLTQEYFYTVQANFVHQAEIFLTKNELSRHDDYFMLSGKEYSTFYTTSAGKTQRFQDSSSSELATFEVFLDPRVNYYNRQVFTILEVVASFGGFYSLLNHIVGVCILFYSRNMMYHSVLSKCYTVYDTKADNSIGEPQVESLSDHQRINSAEQILENQEQSPRIRKNLYPENQKFDSEEVEGGSSQDNNESPANLRNDIPKHEKFRILHQKLKQTRRLGFSYKDCLYNIFWPFKSKKLCKNKYSQYQIYSEGFKQYSSEMNVTRLISAIHQQETLFRAILTTQQRILCDYSNLRNIECAKETSPSFLKIPRTSSQESSANFKESVNMLINTYKHKPLSEVDLSLLNQVDPFLFNTQISPRKSVADSHQRKPVFRKKPKKPKPTSLLKSSQKSSHHSSSFSLHLQDNSSGILPHNKTILSSMKPLPAHGQLSSLNG